MHASFNKWKKIDDHPPIVDEIDFLENQHINQGNQIQQGNENILIFLDMKEQGVKEFQTEIIEKSQIIEEFKKIIFSKYLASINTINMQIINDGILLDQQDRFNNYDIKSNSILKLIKLSQIYPQNWKVHIKTLSGRNYSIDVQSVGMSIAELKQKINDHSGVPTSEQRIIFQGKLLEDQRKLFDYNIKPDDTLHLVLRFLSGCFPGNAPIKLWDGTTKIIKEIEMGDIVMCYDFEQKQFKQSIVVFKKISREKQQLIEIITKIGRIICTPNHPVYTQNGWKALEPHPDFCIETLSASDHLFDLNGKFINIVQIIQVKETEIVYNITTEYPNNFIAFDFLVHNMNKILVQIDETEYEFEVLPHFLIQNLKLMIEKQLSIPISTQQLYFQGILMNDNYALEDYHLLESPSIPDKLILNKIKQSQGNQQEVYQNTNNENYISIITNNQQYQLSIKKNENLGRVKQLLETLESKDYIERSLILCNGKPVSSLSLNNDNTPLTNAQSIFLIDQQSGGIQIKFTLEINDQQLENVAQLKESLQWLGNSQINEFIEVNLEEINGNQQKKLIYQQIPIHSIIAVRLYTSNLIYRRLNNDLRTSDYQSWKKYLKYLMEGLRQMKYYKGIAYRGIRDYQNNTVYQKGKIVQWSEVSSVSLNQQIAQYFSNNKGMIFNVQLISAKDIANISIYEGEQELIMYPFSTFVIDEVQVIPNFPHIVTMRELPLPRSEYVLLWVDDNPENNYNYAQEIERQNNKISVIFCTSTKDAIQIIQKYKWMIYLSQSQFRVVSDMVRIEDGQMNYNAGIDLLSHLYQKMKYKNCALIFCGDEKRALQECKKLNIQGNYEVTNNVQVLKKFLQFK